MLTHVVERAAPHAKKSESRGWLGLVLRCAARPGLTFPLGSIDARIINARIRRQGERSGIRGDCCGASYARRCYSQTKPAGRFANSQRLVRFGGFAPWKRHSREMRGNFPLKTQPFHNPPSGGLRKIHPKSHRGAPAAARVTVACWGRGAETAALIMGRGLLCCV